MRAPPSAGGPSSGTVLCQGATAVFTAPDYDLALTLNCGQAFGWRASGDGWEGVVGSRWVRLVAEAGLLRAEAAVATADWKWLVDYLQLEVNLEEVLRVFPDDIPMREAVRSCRGLRLLQQDPWECLASFILSSTKQIVQIQQITRTLRERYGDPVASLGAPAFAFPTPERLAATTESELRACKMGFRAPYLLATARDVAEGRMDLARLGRLEIDEVRERLIELPGVGRKIADCVLLFAYGFQRACPVDVWIIKALRQLYFRGRNVSLSKLQRFAATHFGPNAGYAQQYLFHHIRTRNRL